MERLRVRELLGARLEEALVERGSSREEARAISEELESGSPIEVLALLARNEALQENVEASIRDQLVERAAEAAGERIPAEAVEEFIQQFILDPPPRPDQLGERFRSREVRVAVIQSLVGSQGELTKQEAEELDALIFEGIMVADLVEIARATHRAGEALPDSLVELVRRIGDGELMPLAIVRGVLSDVWGAVAGLARISGEPDVEQLLRVLKGEQRLDDGDDIDVLHETLSAVFRVVPPIDVMRALAAEVFQRDTTQWAVVLYARANGWPVRREHVEAVSASLRGADLDPLIQAAADVARERAGTG